MQNILYRLTYRLWLVWHLLVGNFALQLDAAIVFRFYHKWLSSNLSWLDSLIFFVLSVSNQLNELVFYTNGPAIVLLKAYKMACTWTSYFPVQTSE